MDTSPSRQRHRGVKIEVSLFNPKPEGKSWIRSLPLAPCSRKYGEAVSTHGFVFMDTPGYDSVSTTGQIAFGANMLCFTTGRGSLPRFHARAHDESLRATRRRTAARKTTWRSTAAWSPTGKPPSQILARLLRDFVERSWARMNKFGAADVPEMR